MSYIDDIFAKRNEAITIKMDTNTEQQLQEAKVKAEQIKVSTTAQPESNTLMYVAGGVVLVAVVALAILKEKGILKL